MYLNRNNKYMTLNFMTRALNSKQFDDFSISQHLLDWRGFTTYLVKVTDLGRLSKGHVNLIWDWVTVLNIKKGPDYGWRRRLKWRTVIQGTIDPDYLKKEDKKIIGYKQGRVCTREWGGKVLWKGNLEIYRSRKRNKFKPNLCGKFSRNDL